MWASNFLKKLTVFNVLFGKKTTTVLNHITNTSNPHNVTKTQVGLSNVDNIQQMPLSYLDIDPLLTSNSDAKVASQKATKTYISTLLSALGALTYKGVIDCSGNPNYPAANSGDLYFVSVAGKIGGVAGIVVNIGDFIICKVNASPAGDQATVGMNWDVVPSGAVVLSGIAPISYNNVTGEISIVDATTLVKGATQLSNSYTGISQVKATTEKALSDGLANKQDTLTFTPEDSANKSTDVTLGGASPSNVKYPSEKAVKTYADTKIEASIPISPGTFTKVTVDANGLVTNGANATTADINDSLNKRYCTDAEKVVIGNTSNTNTGDETTISIGALIHGATDKPTPLDADHFGLMDSVAANVLKKLSWANVKATLKTYFDTIYTLTNLGGVPTSRQVNGHALSADINLNANDIGLGNVDNTSDLNKPISNATATALGNKEDKANKENTIVDTSSIKYPTVGLMKSYVASQVASPLFTTRDVTVTGSAVVSDFFLFCNGTFSLNLYTAAGNKGRVLYIKNIGTGLITINGYLAELIDAQASINLLQYECLAIISNGIGWSIF